MRTILLIVLTLVGLNSGSALQAQSNVTLSFNADWRLMLGEQENAQRMDLDDSEWKSVTLPHAWNEDDAFSKPIHEHSTGIAWYRKTFELPDNAPVDKVFLEFEGLRFGAEFYLNGEWIARHENGVMAVGLDISKYLKKGKNVLAIRTDNRWDYKEKATNSVFQWNDKNFNANYGGIPKNVWIHFKNNLYQTLPLYSNLKTTGTYVYAKDIDVAKRRLNLHVETEVANESGAVKNGNWQIRVYDAEGKLVKSFDKKFTIAAETKSMLSSQALLQEVNFWNWGYGYLYTVESSLSIDNKQIDSRKIKTGFRKTAFKDGMLYLNNQVIMAKGYAQRTSNEWPGVGLSVAPWLSDFSNQLMVESNANMVRWMHVSPWKQDVESCDRVGLMQMLPAGDAEKDVEGRRWEQRTELMRDVIIYYRNNPSVILYESGNESISEQHMAEMKAIRDQYDPYGGRAIGSREMLDSKLAEYGGEMLYINKSAKHPLIATEYMRDEALRKYWDEHTYPYHPEGKGPLYKGNDASDYNRNQDQFAAEAVRRWYEYWRVRPGTGKRVSSGGLNIIFSDSNTHYRGEENYRRSGEVDAMRIPKDAFFAHQVMWDGWVDPDPKGMHIVGHWNYDAGTVKDVLVVSAGDKVELFLNNKKLGTAQQSNRFLFTFPAVQFEAGELKAVSYDAKGVKLSEQTLKTAGLPSQIKLKLLHGANGIYADGNDMVMAEVEVLDENGQRCPTVNPMIDFSFAGPIDWIGGIAQGPNNYIGSTALPAEAGINRVLLRTQFGKPGTVSVKAMSNGLKADSLSFQISDIEQQGAYFQKASSENLPSYMGRGDGLGIGPLNVVRTSLPIASVTSGANQQKAQASIDDNELTDWVNDGKIENAWISYKLEKKSLIDEIDMKLNNFRSKVFPLAIYVDDQKVFDGTTTTSLGYWNAQFPAVEGSTVKIQLKGDTEGKSENQHAEIGGKKLDDGVARNDAGSTGTLSIIEIDLYKRN